MKYTIVQNCTKLWFWILAGDNNDTVEDLNRKEWPYFYTKDEYETPQLAKDNCLAYLKEHHIVAEESTNSETYNGCG